MVHNNRRGQLRVVLPAAGPRRGGLVVRVQCFRLRLLLPATAPMKGGVNSGSTCCVASCGVLEGLRWSLHLRT